MYKAKNSIRYRMFEERNFNARYKTFEEGNKKR